MASLLLPKGRKINLFLVLSHCTLYLYYKLCLHLEQTFAAVFPSRYYLSIRIDLSSEEQRPILFCLLAFLIMKYVRHIKKINRMLSLYLNIPIWPLKSTIPSMWQALRRDLLNYGTSFLLTLVQSSCLPFIDYV